jgi:hypothetical protein
MTSLPERTTKKMLVASILALLSNGYKQRLPLACSLLCWTILQPWRWRRYVPPKRRVPLNALHGVIPQKKILFNVSTVYCWPTACMSQYKQFSIYMAKVNTSVTMKMSHGKIIVFTNFIILIIFVCIMTDFYRVELILPLQWYSWR